MGTYLSRTPSSTGSRTKATVSFWVKRANLKASGNHYILEASSSTSPFNMTRVRFADDLLIIDNTLNGSAASGFYFQSNREYRDNSAWYHIFFSVDVTQANSTDGWKLYVNGVQQTKALTYWVQNANLEWSQSGVQMNIGRRHDNSTEHLDGYLTEFYYIDGTIKSYTDFGETDSTTGIWKPKTYSGSYGTNGFRLEFKNAAALGTDTSGNSNTWTVNNAGTGAQVVDTPSNVFATLTSMGFPQGTRNVLTQGNLDFDFTGDGAQSGQRLDNQCISNIGLTKGKWYAEFKITEDVNGGFAGITNWSNKQNTQNIESFAYIYTGDGDLYYKEKTGAGTSTSSYGAGLSLNDVMMVALDMDNNNVYFGNNGQWGNGSGAWNQANPTSAKNFSSDFINTDSYGVVVFNVAAAGANETPRWLANFGNPPFTIASSNSDGAGYGNFEYAVPSGYYTLCTENLNTYG